MFLHKLGHTFESPKGLVTGAVLVTGFKKKSFPLDVRKVTWVPIHQFFAVDQVVKSSNHSQGAQGLGKDSWGSKSLVGFWPLVKNLKVLETKNFPPYSSCLFLGVQREYSIRECFDMDIAASVLLLEPCVLQITIVQEPNVAHDQINTSWSQAPKGSLQSS